MKYEDKTNRWIAIEVAKRLGKRVSTVTEFHESDGCVVYPHNNQINFDPCTNPSDAWPIIQLIWTDLMSPPYRGYGTMWDNTVVRYSCGKLRAAMICFLKMKDAEK